MPIPPILYLYRLRKQQWLKLAALRELQRRKLRTLVDHAYRNVGYYRKLFDSVGTKPEEIQSVDDLPKIPITTKQSIRDLSASELVSAPTNLSKCRKTLTSGSTGIPLMVYRTRGEGNHLDAVWARAFLENGARVWDKNADYHTYTRIPKRWFEHFGIWRRVMIPILECPKAQAKIIQQVRPQIIRANPFELVDLAMTVHDQGLNSITPRLIFSMGSTLNQQSRTYIESILHTKVFDYYGATELGCIAWECSERSGYHINIESVVLEVVNNQGQPVGSGERGKLVCTSLISFTMPFLRYEIGDSGILSDAACECGRGLPLLKTLEGRVEDFLVMADGSLIAPGMVCNSVKNVPGLLQYKIVQETVTDIRAEILLDKNAPRGADQTVKDILKRLVGGEVNITVREVAEIPRNPSGKITTIESKVKSNRLSRVANSEH